MNAKTPMALDEVLAVMDEAIHWTEATFPTPLRRPGESTQHPVHVTDRLHDLRQARATIAALQSAHAEEVAGLREECAALTRQYAAPVFADAALTVWKSRAEQAEARLARVEADARCLHNARTHLPTKVETKRMDGMSPEEIAAFDSGYNAALDRAHLLLMASLAPANESPDLADGDLLGASDAAAAVAPVGVGE